MKRFLKFQNMVLQQGKVVRINKVGYILTRIKKNIKSYE